MENDPHRYHGLRADLTHLGGKLRVDVVEIIVIVVVLILIVVVVMVIIIVVIIVVVVVVFVVKEKACMRMSLFVCVSVCVNK